MIMPNLTLTGKASVIQDCKGMTGGAVVSDATASDSDFQSGTGAGLSAFLLRLGERGEINQNTAANLRRAAEKVLGIEDPSSVDIRNLDVDEILDRFENLNRLSYTDTSLQTYRSRFRLGVELYQRFLAADPAWKSLIKRDTQRTGGGRTAKKGGKGGEKQPSPWPDHTPLVSLVTGPSRSRTVASEATEHELPRLVTYDVPLRPDLLIRLNLPVDLTLADAERLCAFVRSLAFKPTANAVTPPETREEEP